MKVLPQADYACLPSVYCPISSRNSPRVRKYFWFEYQLDESSTTSGLCRSPLRVSPNQGLAGQPMRGRLEAHLNVSSQAYVYDEIIYNSCARAGFAGCTYLRHIFLVINTVLALAYATVTYT
jgi:hypothetical protein